MSSNASQDPELIRFIGSQIERLTSSLKYLLAHTALLTQDQLLLEEFWLIALPDTYSPTPHYDTHGKLVKHLKQWI